MSGPFANENIAKIIGAFEQLGFHVVEQAEQIRMERENGDGTRTQITVPDQALFEMSMLGQLCDEAGISPDEFTSAYDQVSRESVPGEPPADESPVDESPADELTDDVVKRKFEDLTLSEMLGRLIRRPWETAAAFGETVFQPPVQPETGTDEQFEEADETDETDETVSDAAASAEPVEPMFHKVVVVEKKRRRAAPAEPAEPFDWRATFPLIGLGLTVLVAMVGSVMLSSTRGEASERILPAAGGLMIGAALLMAAIAVRSIPFARLPALTAPTLPRRTTQSGVAGWLETYGLRLALALIGVLWVIGAWFYNSDNKFTDVGVFCWIMAIATWTVVFWERRSEPAAPGWFARLKGWFPGLFAKPISFRLTWTIIALIVILLVGGWFRFRGLGTYPADMTSDHVEKALDAQRVFEGDRSVFFPNNGGREGFQMYYLALLKTVTGMPVGLTFIQIGSGIEGMVMILLAFWMGRAVIGDEDKQLGNLTGLIMAALIAISFWHVLLSRLGLRIVTTTLDVSIVFVFLARGLRYNRRRDFIYAGLALGVGMYCYQAIRMLPLVVIAGFIFALILRARSRRDLGRYTMNLIALIVVALVVFVPLARYMQQYPNEFWSRTSGRLFGEEGVTSVSGAIAAFEKNLPGLADNMKRSLLMFNYQGDTSWFNGAPDGTPELDFFAGGLFILGLGLIGYRMFKRRDPVDWLLPAGIVIMLLPAALSIAFTIEVPSLTRASGTLPMVYLVAALPLAVILRMVSQRLRGRRFRFVIYGVVIVCLVLAANANSYDYFVTAMKDYRDSTLPHRQAGQLMAGFAASTGSLGNAFVPAFPNWWDFRALAIEAGDPHWANIIWRDPNTRQNLLDLITRNMGTPYEIRTDRQILIFLNPADAEMIALAANMFPGGQTFHIAAYKPDRDFLIYIAPPASCDWVQKNTGQLPKTCPQADTGESGSPAAQATPEPTDDP